MQWSIERVVTLLTPAFGALSAWLTGLIAANFPGLPTLPAGDVTALEIAGFTGAVGAALKWLHGRQKFVQFEGDVDKFVDKVVATVKANQTAAPALADIEAILKPHTDAIVKTVLDAVHAPPSVDEVVKQIAKQLVNPQPVSIPIAGPSAVNTSAAVPAPAPIEITPTPPAPAA